LVSDVVNAGALQLSVVVGLVVPPEFPVEIVLVISVPPVFPDVLSVPEVPPKETVDAPPTIDEELSWADVPPVDKVGEPPLSELQPKTAVVIQRKTPTPMTLFRRFG
jgi:hypothetical protein